MANERDVPPPALLTVVRAHGLLLAAAVVVGGGAALSWAAIRPSLYEASATVVVTAGDVTPTAQAAALSSARTLLENRSNAAAMIRARSLEGPPEWLSADELIVERLRVSQIRDTSSLRVDLRLRSRDTVAAALRELVERAVKLNSELVREEANSPALAVLKHQIADAQSQLRGVTDQLLALQRSTRVEELRLDAEGAMGRRARIHELGAVIAAERARLAGTQAQLNERQRDSTSPGTAAPLLEHRRRLPEEQRSPPLSLAELRGEPAKPRRPAGEPATRRSDPPPIAGANLSDPVFDILDYEAAMTRTRIAALEGERAALQRQSGAALDRLYAAEAELQQLTAEREFARETLSRFRRQYEAVRETAATRSLHLHMTDQPTPPGRASSPNLWLSAAVGSALGLMGALGLAFFRWRATAHPS